jgi:branched-chain amino acid transport system permease protein
LATLTDVYWHIFGGAALTILLGSTSAIPGPAFGAGTIVGLQNYPANIGSWGDIVAGLIFVVYVLAFRRKAVGEITHLFKSKGRSQSF